MIGGSLRIGSLHGRSGRVLDVVELVLLVLVVVGCGLVGLVLVVTMVVVGAFEHEQSLRQVMNTPPALEQVLPGGSHCSPGSRWPLPQSGTVVLVVVATTVVLVVL